VLLLSIYSHRTEVSSIQAILCPLMSDFLQDISHGAMSGIGRVLLSGVQVVMLWGRFVMFWRQVVS
jgi:hypothetical protein